MNKDDVPKPKALVDLPNAVFPVYEECDFSQFEAPEDIADLIRQIEEDPHKFTPDKIKEAIAYAEKSFRDVINAVSISSQIREWKKEGYSDVYEVHIQRNAFDYGVIAGAGIHFRGIALHDNACVDSKGLDELTKRVMDFNGAQSPSSSPIVVVSPGKRVEISAESFKTYNMLFGTSATRFGSANIIGHTCNLLPTANWEGLVILSYDCNNRVHTLEDLGCEDHMISPTYQQFSSIPNDQPYRCLARQLPRDDYSFGFENLGPGNMYLSFRFFPSKCAEDHFNRQARDSDAQDTGSK